MSNVRRFANMPEQETRSPPKLLDRVRQCVQLKGYASATEDAYHYWVRRFILFHRKRHPETMGPPEVEQFLTHLAESEHLSASSQNQALSALLCSALLFLYKHVLHLPLSESIASARAKGYKPLPVVLSIGETRRLLDELKGTTRLMAELAYGAGLRLMEVHRLRVGHVDFESNRLQVIDSKGRKDRTTILPISLIEPLQRHLLAVRQLHIDDLNSGFGSAVLPRAYYRKSKTASRQFKWQFVFPASGLFEDQKSGNSGRWHIHSGVLQRAVRLAADRADIRKRVTVHALRHSFATHMLQQGTDIRTIQVLLGHNHVNTTMIYAHVVDNLRLSSRSPLDLLLEKSNALAGSA
jgi:integron integrase